MRIFKFTLASGLKIKLKPPALRAYYELIESGRSDDILIAVAHCCRQESDWIIQNFTANDLCKFIEKFAVWIRSEREKDLNLQTPYVPEESDYKPYLSNKSGDLKIVSDYTGLNFNEVYQLEIFDYWQYLHDAVVWNCSKTEQGRDYLEKAYMLKQTEPERGLEMKGMKLRHGKH